jgi:hypothetical protein
MCPHSSSRVATARSEIRGYYSRLFPQPASPLAQTDEEKLVRLGQSMRYVMEREGTLTPRVGFTYFGQFIGHDLTHDLTPLAGPYLDAERTRNYRSAYLNLDQLYGGGPENSPRLYEGDTGTEMFKIGRTTGQGYPRDLSIENGHVLVADSRNLDNLILRQLHVVFLKFHNEAVRQLRAKLPGIVGTEGLETGTVFGHARQIVRWHYQWIIRHHFLPRILHQSFWMDRRRFARHRHSCNGDFSIPVEFSLAAYRFGHSMVRKAYGLNCRQRRVDLSQLMALGHQASPIADDFVIEWGRFFDGLPASGPVASSAYLDTSIALPLHGLSLPVVQLSSHLERSGEPASLPVRTLLRGARSRLPTGQQVAEALIAKGIINAEHCLTHSELTRNTCDCSGTVLQNVVLDQDTPLFYYLLKEADIFGSGLTLGPIGSHIVAGVIAGAIAADPESYVSIFGPSWTLPLWRFPSGSQRPVNSLIAIIQLIGDDQLLPECEARWRNLLPLQNQVPRQNGLPHVLSVSDEQHG